MIYLLALAISGLIVGALGRLVIPGPNPMSIPMTMLVGVGAKSTKADSRLLLVLPLVVSIAFFLIADIDSPRRGTIRVIPQNLLSLSQSLHAR